VLFIAGAAAVIVGVVSYLRPRPLLSEDDTPDVIYQKVLNAYGGQASWERWRSGRTQYEKLHDSGIGPRIHFRETFQFPDKLRREFTGTFGTDTKAGLLVVNGDSEWAKEGNNPIEKRPAVGFNPEHGMSIDNWFHPYYLLDRGKNLTVLGTAPGSESGTDLILKVQYDDVPEPSECRIDIRTGLIR
jgi:hypothetical protein